MGPVGIPQIIFIIAILGFALWKTGWIRAILSLCLVIWGVFILAYDIKIAAPLITAGGILFISTIFDLIAKYKRSAEE